MGKGIVIYQKQLEFRTKGRGTIDITDAIADVVQSSQLDIGLCQLFIQHTSASLIICENADPAVRRDCETFMARLIPDGDPAYTHTAEGPDDMPAHLRTILTQTAISIPVRGNKLFLGTWQGIYLWEHLTPREKRKVVVTVHD